MLRQLFRSFDFALLVKLWLSAVIWVEKRILLLNDSVLHGRYHSSTYRAVRMRYRATLPLRRIVGCIFYPGFVHGVDRS